MEQNLKTTIKKLVTAAALLIGLSTLAAFYLPQAANAAPKRSLIYYRIVPDWRNHVPHEVGDSDYGIYRHSSLPDGTVTGPIGPDVNGG